MRRLALVVTAGALAGGCGTDAARVDPQLAPRQAGTTVIWAVGDGADGGSQGKQVARMIRADRPDRFLYLGDVYERGTAAEFRRNYSPVYGALNRITSPTPGNHEWGNRRTRLLPLLAPGQGPHAAQLLPLRASAAGRS